MKRSIIFRGVRRSALVILTLILILTALISSNIRNSYSYTCQEWQETLLGLINQERANNGLAPLTVDQELVRAATVRAQEASVSWSHTRPDGTPFWTVSDWTNAEDLAKGFQSPRALLDGWLASPTHKDIIFDGSLSLIGLYAYTNENGVVYVAAEFR